MMKKILLKLAVLALVALAVLGCSNPSGGGGGPPPDLWDGSIAGAFAGGSGDSDIDPYIISTSAQLAFLAEQVNAGEPYTDVHFILANNLNLNGDTYEWIAIGTDYTHNFGGNFDGAGHVIHGLVINKPDTIYPQGLFGYLDGAAISNLGLEGVAITGKAAVGGIAGGVYNNGSIENCYSTGTVSGTGNYTGGIAGYVDSSGISGSYSTGTVSGTGNYTGGIAGYVNNSGISGSYSTGTVSRTGDCVGGIAGFADGSSIENCYSTGDVSGDEGVGGIAGSLGAGNSSIENCYSTGAVSGTNVVGGIAGFADGSIENCYSTGAVSGTTGVGGIAGFVYSNSIKNCAALNYAVTATSGSAGRVVGYIDGSSNTFTGNIAWEDMTGGPFSNDPDTDGTGIAAEEVKNGTSLPDSLKNNPWIYTIGELPILDGLEGQNGTLPAYITGEWDGNPSGGFAGGSGTPGDPYRISTAAQLAYLAQQVNSGKTLYAGKYFILIKNLDLSGHEWTAIGTSVNRFKGNFDGDSHVISSLSIDKNDTDYQGLFGYLDGAEVSNLGLADVTIQGQIFVGGIAGYVSDSSISGSYSTGEVSGTSYYIGGIAGVVSNSGSIENCYSTGTVSGDRYIGGIAGWVNWTSSIENCYSTGAVNGTGDYYVGGIAGFVDTSSIENCYSTGEANGEDCVGGIAGYVYGSSIDNSYSTGTVNGTSHIGGIAGFAYNNGSVKNCAALNPSVTAAGNAGRVVGNIGSSGTFTGNVAWEGMTAGDAVSDGSNKDGTGITTAQVQDGSKLPDSLKNNPPWIYIPGGLPILKDLEGQDDTLPTHLE